MSAVAGEVPTGGRRLRFARARLSGTDFRADLTVLSFVALAGYGLLRWQTMLPHTMRLRFVGLLVLATILVVVLRVFLRVGHRRVLTVVLGIAGWLVIIAMIPMSGFPLSWATHLRVAVTARAVSNALAALPTVTVPYIGGDAAVMAVIALGGGLLMVSSALALAGASGRRSLRQRALAAVPLLVLAIVPGAIGRPHLQAVHGAALFLLLVLFLFSGRQVGRRFGGPAALLLTVVMICAVGALAVPAGSALSSGRAWVNVNRLVAGIGPAPISAFNWSQTYGPLSPSGGNGNATVLTVRARFPTYWKAENLDVFNGHSWTLLPPGTFSPVQAGLPRQVDRTQAREWVQRLDVTVGAMKMRHLVAAGVAAYPALRSGGARVFPMSSPGTWETSKQLSSGDSYSVDVYTPRPTTKELADAGVQYPADIVSEELSMEMPHPAQTVFPQRVQFAAFGSNGSSSTGGRVPTTLFNGGALRGSPYEPVLQLATKLEANTRTPYQYVQAVMRYLGHGYRYTLNPPRTKNPIAGFLLDTKVGYCQQFAGAMALLLRMGGVPARVAVGFTTGTADAAKSRYLVTASDAHAWVEVWFPGYGWVPFDPTPSSNKITGAAPGNSVNQQVAPPKASGSAPAPKTKGQAPPPAASGSSPAAAAGQQTRVSTLTVVAVLIGLVGLLALWFGKLRRRLRGPRPAPSPQALVRDLERAFARCGRPLPAATTLSALESQVAATDGTAAEYVRRLRTARFSAGADRPTADQRRALRAWLAAQLGPTGRLRALLALPPRRLD